MTAVCVASVKAYSSLGSIEWSTVIPVAIFAVCVMALYGIFGRSD